MEKHKKRPVKILSLVMAIAMTVTALPGTALAAVADGMSECHPVHDADCGFAEAAEGSFCAHTCAQCEGQDSGEAVEEVEKDSALPVTCVCTVQCAAPDAEAGAEAASNAACPVCAADNGDFTNCTGEAPVLLANADSIAKRTICLGLYDPSSPLDKDGKALTSNNGIFDMLTTEGWKWDSNTLTLTLSGANIEATDRPALLLPQSGNTTIVLEGDNFLKSNRNTLQGGDNLAINGSGSLNIINTGSSGIVIGQPYETADLTITGGTLTVTSEDSASSGDAIRVYGALSILGGDISVRSKKLAIWAEGDMVIDNAEVDSVSAESNAVGTNGALTISNGATITAESSYPPLFSKGDMSITGSKVTAASTLYAAINSSGNITFTDSDITAKSILTNYTAIYADKALTVDGSSQVLAEGGFRGLHGNTAVVITDTAQVETAGVNGSGIYSQDIQISGSAVVNATNKEGNGGAITSTANISITGDAEVEATGWYDDGIFATGTLMLAGKNINAFAVTGDAVDGRGDITIDGKLTAESNGGSAIRSASALTANSKADITAISGYGWGRSLDAMGDILLNGSKVEASATNDNAIYSDGTIRINGGSVHAKGGKNYAAILALNVQTSGEAAASNIELTNVMEQNGGKVAFSDWFILWEAQTSVTSFIAAEENTLVTNSNTGTSNGLEEVWLVAPYTVTFDVNGGSGTNSTVTVIPNNKVSAPETTPTKSGFHFTGWYLDATKFDFQNTGITADITLKAQFDPHTPNADDGSCTTAIVCSVCGEITTPAKTHNWGTAWTTDSSGHWHLCTNSGCAQIKDKAAHTLGDWIVDKAATETEKGSKHKECTVCLYVAETQEIPPTSPPLKPVPPTPAAPALAGLLTARSVSVKTVAGQSYLCTAESTPPALTAALWKPGTGEDILFHGLTPNTTYYLWTYIPKSDSHSDSAVSAATVVTTKAPGTSVENLTDVEKNGWYVDAVEYVLERDLFRGTSPTTFAPHEGMTRAMFYVVLSRIAGLDLPDKGDNWYVPAMEWAMREGLTDGETPMKNITREQMATMLYRYAGKGEAIDYSVLDKFHDSSRISYWAKDAMAWCVQTGILRGDTHGNLNPQAIALRAEAATILMRYGELEKNR